MQIVCFDKMNYVSSYFLIKYMILCSIKQSFRIFYPDSLLSVLVAVAQ